jgi:hypothetical protein
MEYCFVQSHCSSADLKIEGDTDALMGLFHDHTLHDLFERGAEGMQLRKPMCALLNHESDIS